LLRVSIPDIFLEMDSTRVVGPLDVHTRDTSGTTRISADPSDASVTVHSGGGVSEPRFELHQQGPANLQSETAAVFESWLGADGRLTLKHRKDDVRKDDGTVRFDDEQGEGRFEIGTESAPGGVRVYSNDGSTRASGGVISIENDSESLSDAVEIRARQIVGEDAAGFVEVQGEDKSKVTLEGDDAALELTGDVPAAGGGGELLIRRWPTTTEVSGSPEPDDIHVHVTADSSSGYGRANGNPPRISIDGPSARVDLGRERIDSVREGTAGRFKLRTRMGGPPNTMVEGGVREPSGSPLERHPELVFRRGNQGTLETRGAVTAEPRGLVFSDAGTGTNQKAALIVRKNATVETRFPVQESIPKVGPQFRVAETLPNQNETGELPFLAGDASTIDWQIGDESTEGYEVRGTIDRQGGTDVRMALVFDTSEAGDSDEAVTLDGDWSRTVDYQTSLSKTLPTGQYSVDLSDQYGADNGQVIVQ
jgi:hypothetical protein